MAEIPVAITFPVAPEVVAEIAADELILTTQIFDHGARRRSLEIVAAVRDAAAG